LGAYWIADAIGRKKTMIAVAASYAVFAALAAFSPDVGVLYAVRFLLGVAIGISIVAAPLFIAESTPARFRGAAVATYQVACVAGIAISSTTTWNGECGPGRSDPRPTSSWPRRSCTDNRARRSAVASSSGLASASGRKEIRYYLR
jgi:hypothetical protein